ncbi:pentatricopeptide repeat-containing protein [Hibiscus syriacus]|uniref:Pentatricopeptide repeat-containing protein n=1 Tax=Hibiscus syriacus TaxID=106335 RepID=A0A6A2Z978_HIBSY|nr:pentatricopeptide repeat-containing protein [Hibiscus syriacus]
MSGGRLKERTSSQARRHSNHHQATTTTTTTEAMPTYFTDSLTCPFGELATNLSESELRETAYEILVGACRTTGGKPLTYISQSERNSDRTAAPSPSLTPSASLQRSLTSTAASKVKKALGLRSSRGRKASSESDSERVKKAVTIGELLRVQLGISEQTDSRVRRALLRIAAAQLGRRTESIVLPLEMLQQLKSSDFPNQGEFEAWQRRNLKLLEAGLLLHPFLPLDEADNSPQRLRQIIRRVLEEPLETGKNNESMQTLRSIVLSLACRQSFDGSISETSHWADGLPLNLKIYQVLLEACFDVNDETSVIEEVDEVLELVKKTWVVLGMNQMQHNLCFLWILFNRRKGFEGNERSDYSKILSSTLSAILGWAEKKLLAYHNYFNSDNTELMECVVSMGVLSAKIMVEGISLKYRKKRKEIDVAHERVDTYIRSSLRTAFIMEKVKASKRSSNKNQQNQLPFLSSLAQDVTTLAFSEKAIFSPILKRWHPLPAGVAVATLHSCYGNELKQFVSEIGELTPDILRVLRAAEKLEKDLVQIAVENSTRLDRLKEWVDRNLQLEVWDPRANKERFAPSAVEVLRIVDEALEAFFLLPISIHASLLPDLTYGIDRCLQHYISKATSSCGTRSSFVPSMYALTRCSTRSKFPGVFKKKEKFQRVQSRKSQVGTTNGNDLFGIPQLCCRINTLQHIRTELNVLAKRTIAHLRNSESPHVENVIDGMGKAFELSAAACLEGIQQLCEATAYKVIFHDLSHVLWDGLYVGEVSSSRIEPFLQELEHYLEVISLTVHDRVRTRVITEVMKASFDGFLLVLLAGGPARAFSLQDYETIAEDFRFLTDLFWSNGDGLPADLIEKFSTTVKPVLPLFHTDTDSLIEQFKYMTTGSYGSSAKSKLPLPPTSGQWSPTEPNTLLRVLCYRKDETAAKFLKKTYNLPKKL